MFGSLNAAGVSAEAQIENLGETGNVTPPDSTGAIGPSDYVEFINEEIVAYARANLAQEGTPVDITTFVGDGHAKGSACDPQIKYDPQTSRWFYSAIECNGTTAENTLYVGFSKTSDPTDFSTAVGHGWCGYSYAFGGVFEDYPKLGLDPLHIVIGTNSFKATSPFSFFTSHIFSLPKPAAGKIEACPEAPALATFGSKAGPLRTSVEGHIAFTPEPATVTAKSTSGYVVAADFGAALGSGKNIMIWKLAGTAKAPVLEALGAPAVPAYMIPPFIPQPGSSDKIDSLDSRLTQAMAAVDPGAGEEEAVWTQHTVAGGGGSVVRWYELLPGKLEAKQVGTISDPSKFVFNGAIAPTLTGGAVINYNTASPTTLVQIMAQSRVASAPAGAMNTPILLGSSAEIDSDFSCPSQPLGKELEAESCRWGDYAGASVDPSNGEVVWGSNQLNGPTGASTIQGNKAQWATRNFALEANDVAPSASFTASTASSNPNTPGFTVAFNGSASADPDGSIAAYSWNFGDGSAAGSGVAPSHTYGAPGSYTVTLTVTDNGGHTATDTHSVTVTDNGGQTATDTQPVTTNAPPAPALLAPAIAARTPGSNFTTHAVTFNPKTGAITFTASVSDPGAFSWLLTFPNGKFGVFASRSTRCKTGLIRLNGKCRRAKIVFARGSKTVAAPGSVSFTLKPTRSALRALRNALKRKKGLPVTIRLTFQSAFGGSPVSLTRSLTVKLKKR